MTTDHPAIRSAGLPAVLFWLNDLDYYSWKFGGLRELAAASLRRDARRSGPRCRARVDDLSGGRAEKVASAYDRAVAGRPVSRFPAEPILEPCRAETRVRSWCNPAFVHRRPVVEGLRVRDHRPLIPARGHESADELGDGHPLGSG